MKFNLGTDGRNTRYILLTSLGGCISVMGYLIYVLNPLQLIVDKLLTLQSGSFLFRLWSEPPFDIFARIYIFNVTNSERFLAGEEKLDFAEVGPFVFREILRNTEPTFNANGTLTFKPRRELVFVEEMSAGNPALTAVTVPNVPLLGIASYLRDEFGLLVNLGFSSVVGMLGTSAVKNLTVEEYLFGYDEPLVELASRYVPSWIDFQRFGIIDRLMSLDNGNNTVTMHLPGERPPDDAAEGDDRPLPYSISRFNGSPGLRQWGYDDANPPSASASDASCQTVEGAFDGALFPRRLRPNTTLRLYRRAFCRSIAMRQTATARSASGLPYFAYSASDDFLSPAAERCFCAGRPPSACAPPGFGAVAPCYYGIPIAISRPHFLGADAAALAAVTGLRPDAGRHGMAMAVSAEYGVPLAAHLRVQINLRVAAGQVVGCARPFAGLMLPLLWVELGLDGLPARLRTLLGAAGAARTVEVVAGWVLGVVGVSLVATAALWRWFYGAPARRLEESFREVEYSPVLLLPHIASELRRIS